MHSVAIVLDKASQVVHSASPMEVVREIGVRVPKCGIHDGKLQFVTRFKGNLAMYICERLPKTGPKSWVLEYVSLHIPVIGPICVPSY